MKSQWINMSTQKHTIFTLIFCVLAMQVKATCFLNISSVQCQTSKSFCSQSVCNTTLVNQFSLVINELRCILGQDILFPNLRLRHEIKAGPQKYRPGLFDHHINVCELAKGFNVPFLNVFIPKEKLDAVLHPCPYKKKEVITLLGISFDTRNIPIVHQPGEYRVTFSLTKGKFAQAYAFVVHGFRCVNID